MSYNDSDMSSNESTSDSNDQIVDAHKDSEMVEPSLSETTPKTKKYNVNTSQNFTRLVNTC